MRSIILPLLSLVLIFSSCGTMKEGVKSEKSEKSDNGPITIISISTEKSYGSEKNPIMVGGVADSKGPANERSYLDLLAGPNGEKISYTRVGSCCAVESKNGFMGKGMLDIYEIKYDGLSKPIELYINMYDYQTLYAPKGFTIR